jgi:membrane protein insertase Oxa1/YidC/SpoIIIJ
MPLMTVFVGASLPAGLTLYWVVMNIMTILQQLLAFTKNKAERPVAVEPE